MVMSDGVIHSEHLPAAIQRSAQPRPAAAENGPALSGSLDEALEEWERRMILNALSQTQGVQARAAKLLGVSERSLWYRIKKLGIQVRTPEDGPPAG
jgi:transcriptional regulator with PAS, ATPase and Fis domain